jgi:hypothetical protein
MLSCSNVNTQFSSVVAVHSIHVLGIVGRYFEHVVVDENIFSEILKVDLGGEGGRDRNFLKQRGVSLAYVTTTQDSGLPILTGKPGGKRAVRNSLIFRNLALRENQTSFLCLDGVSMFA